MAKNEQPRQVTDREEIDCKKITQALKNSSIAAQNKTLRKGEGSVLGCSLMAPTHGSPGAGFFGDQVQPMVS
ncbi:MAG: hypothetical protein GXY53_02540 [Desulfobulbus sp.]|nr:hypothetical protein [Desulfobulbus sp.]